MLEALAGTGLAAAAGLNAYIPLLALGLMSRFTDLLALPSGWAWLESPWVLVILGVLLVLEMVADKIPAVDHVNDVIQTVIRPTSGGIVFGSGSGAETPAIADPEAFFTSGSWVPVAIGVGVALAVHAVKAAVRAAATATFAGLASPVLSVGEDFASVGLVAAAVLLPVAVLIGLVLLAVAATLLISRVRRRARRRPELAVSR